MNPQMKAPVAIAPWQMFVRCFAERKQDQWQAFSVEFGLAAQADTLEDVRAKLDSMLICYLEDALGEDRKHARELLTRKSTFSVWYKYHFYAAVQKLRKESDDSDGSVFSEMLPLAPVGCAA